MLTAYQVSLDLIRELRPIVVALKQYDRDLAGQLQRAATSVTLNLGEGQGRAGGDRRRCYEIATGSAREVGAALDVAAAWEWPVDVVKSRALLHRLGGLLWGLTHGRRPS